MAAYVEIVFDNSDGATESRFVSKLHQYNMLYLIYTHRPTICGKRRSYLAKIGGVSQIDVLHCCSVLRSFVLSPKLTFFFTQHCFTV